MTQSQRDFVGEQPAAGGQHCAITMRLDQSVERGVVDRQRIDGNTVARSERELKAFEGPLVRVESLLCGFARSSRMHRLDV